MAVFGGGFDPLHNGHVDIVNHALSVVPCDQLMIVPTGRPVHKPNAYFSSDIRLAMLQSVFGENRRIIISEYELKKTCVSYTIDTIQYLFREYQVQSMTLIVGFDQLYQFHRWRQYERILMNVNLVVLLRHGIDHDRLIHMFPKELVPFKDQITIHDMTPTHISSSKIRIMLQKKESIEKVVPMPVIDIINTVLE
ncbi:MAG: nicotinate (nicotinamide) nucleotide adenylyltransferase [Candidatus Marinamargulisbacteria bacterium]